MERTIELPRRFDAATARRLAETLGEHRGSALRFEASAVESVSAMGIELIIAIARQWQADGKSFTLSGLSERFKATCQTLGLNAERPWEILGGERA